MKPNLKKLQTEVDAWNAKVKVGQEISYSEILGDPPKIYKTRTEAQILSGHTAVLWVHGKGGCVALKHCVPIEQPPIAAKSQEGACFPLSAQDKAHIAEFMAHDATLRVEVGLTPITDVNAFLADKVMTDIRTQLQTIRSVKNLKPA